MFMTVIMIVVVVVMNGDDDDGGGGGLRVAHDKKRKVQRPNALKLLFRSYIIMHCTKIDKFVPLITC